MHFQEGWGRGRLSLWGRHTEAIPTCAAAGFSPARRSATASREALPFFFPLSPDVVLTLPPLRVDAPKEKAPPPAPPAKEDVRVREQGVAAALIKGAGPPIPQKSDGTRFAPRSLQILAARLAFGLVPGGWCQRWPRTLDAGDIAARLVPRRDAAFSGGGGRIFALGASIQGASPDSCVGVQRRRASLAQALARGSEEGRRALLSVTRERTGPASPARSRGVREAPFFSFSFSFFFFRNAPSLLYRRPQREKPPPLRKWMYVHKRQRALAEWRGIFLLGGVDAEAGPEERERQRETWKIHFDARRPHRRPQRESPPPPSPPLGMKEMRSYKACARRGRSACYTPRSECAASATPNPPPNV